MIQNIRTETLVLEKNLYRQLGQYECNNIQFCFETNFYLYIIGLRPIFFTRDYWVKGPSPPYLQSS